MDSGEEILGRHTNYDGGLASNVCKFWKIKVRQGAESLLLLKKEHEGKMRTRRV